MTRTRVLVIAALVLAVCIVVIVLMRADLPSRRSTATAVRDPDTRAARDGRGVTRPREPVRLAMPAPAVADATVPEACAHGTGGDPGWWDCLPPTPTWDAKRAAYLIDRLAKRFDLTLEPRRIECRTRCCRVLVPRELWVPHQDDVSSSVGLRIGPTDGYIARPTKLDDQTSDYEIITCWKPGDIDDYPDRAIERDDLLAAAADDLASCGRSLKQPVSLSFMLELGESGEIADIERRSQADEAVVPCVEAALRKAADFEPPPDIMTRSVPVRVRLPP